MRAPRPAPTVKDMPCRISARVPAWVSRFVARAGALHPRSEDQMALVVALSAENVRRKTGGPFGAAIFDLDGGRIVSAGVNLVVSANCSVLHAEIVALALAQSRLEHYDLATVGSRRYALVTSTEPCAMCLGAIPWSGVRMVVCGARDEDARRAGFDEGAKPADWVRQLKRRGIAVLQDVLRSEASAVLADYAADGGIIYNGRGW